MLLALKRFTEVQSCRNYTLNEFTEEGIPFAVLVESRELAYRLDHYKFGVKTKDGDLYWFFNGKSTTEKREEAIKIYNELVTYCKENNVGKPFAYKPGIYIKKNKEQ